MKAWAYITLLVFFAHNLSLSTLLENFQSAMERYVVSGELTGREEDTDKDEKRWEKTKIKWVFLAVSERQITVARRHVQPTKHTVPLSVLMYFLLPSFFPLQPTSPRCPVSASRHHGSAFSDCLHADGCRDYACHFRFCSPDRSVSFCLCTCAYLLSGFLVFFGGKWHCS